MDGMANYIAIIELHTVDNEENSQQLDAAMAERQFFPQIRDDDGKAYWLPTGSYAIQNTDMGYATTLGGDIEPTQRAALCQAWIVSGLSTVIWPLSMIAPPPCDTCHSSALHVNASVGAPCQMRQVESAGPPCRNYESP